MEGVRRHLRVWSFAWLVCQAALLSAFIPRACCAAHAHAASAATPECHKPVADTHCPMPGADGEACPMHQANGTDEDCRLRGMCDGPMSALAQLFSSASLPVHSLNIALDPPPVSPVNVVAQYAVQRSTPPDSPPPRA